MNNVSVFELAKDFEERDILEAFNIDYRLGGDFLKIICPFHNDTHFGSFIFNTKEHFFKCFACGEYGDIIDLIARIEGLKPYEAAYEICYLMGAIDKKGNFKRNIKRKKKIEEKPEEIKVRDIDTLDSVYRLFLSQLDLSNDHRKYLKEKRKISDEDIEKRLYRTFRWESQFMASKVLSRMKYYDIDPKLIKGVPGFFYDEEAKGWSINTSSGLAIPIFDSKNRIQAIQIRLEDMNEWGKPNKLRYIWFSSSNKNMGVSPGAPIDVLRSNNLLNNTIFITEGRFKSEVIIEKFNCYSLSIQGVGNWKGISDIIKDIEAEIGECSIIIAFDNDIWSNEGVKKQLANLINEVKKEKKEELVQAISWGTQYKGIDDLFIELGPNAIQHIYRLENI